MPARKPTDVIQIGLRVRESMRQRLMRAAGHNGTSVNQEINHRLAQSFDAGAMRTLEELVADLGKIRGRLRQSA